MAGRKVLVQDDGTGHMAYVDEAPTVLLTGDETTTGHFFRGPDDPADTPAFLALLLPGDHWTDTTIVTGWPFVEKVRNAANDGWDFAGLVLTVAGKVRGVVRLEPSGGGANVSMATYDADENEMAAVEVLNDGSALLRTDTVPGKDVKVLVNAGGISLALGLASIALATDETIYLGPGFGLVIGSDLPTSDPAVAGALWEEPVTFNIKRSQG